MKQTDSFTDAINYANDYMQNKFAIDAKLSMRIEDDALHYELEIDVAALVYQMSCERGVLDDDSDPDDLAEEACAFELAIHNYMSEQGYLIDKVQYWASTPLPKQEAA